MEEEFTPMEQLILQCLDKVAHRASNDLLADIVRCPVTSGLSGLDLRRVGVIAALLNLERRKFVRYARSRYALTPRGKKQAQENRRGYVGFYLNNHPQVDRQQFDANEYLARLGFKPDYTQQQAVA